MENAIIRITDENPSYTSLVANTRKEKAILVNAKSNPSHKLSEFINKKITFSNVCLEKTLIMEKDKDGNPTGEVHDAIRTVLITPDGDGIVSTSKGVAQSLYDIFSVFGTPDMWGDEPMEVIVRQIEIGKGRMFKLEVV